MDDEIDSWHQNQKDRENKVFGFHWFVVDQPL